jgi:pyridinium-3,5-bisthiocarboxylic acid mononucleotide nickel chelatase
VIGHATSKLLDAGALDVYTTAIQMKKSRPGVLVTVLAPSELAARLEKILFRETGTLGVRRWLSSRHKLERRQLVVQTSLGPIEGKLATLSDGSESFSPEYEACRIVAAEKNIPLREVYEIALRAFDQPTNLTQ